MTTTATEISPVLSLSPNGFVGAEFLSDPAYRESWGGGLDDLRDKFENIVDGKATKQKQINASDKLSNKGKSDATIALRKETKAACFGVFKSKLPWLNATRNRLLQSLPTWPDRPSSDLDESRQREIRSVWRAKQPVERGALIGGLADQGRISILASLLNDPAEEIIRPADVDDLKQRCLRAAYPDAYRRLDAFEIVASLMKSNLNRALSALGFDPQMDDTGDDE